MAVFWFRLSQPSWWPIVLVLVAKWHRDVAWLTGGVMALWIALIGFRALH